MIKRNLKRAFDPGYTAIVQHADNSSADSMLLNFGIVLLNAHCSEYISNSTLEQALLLIRGQATLLWEYEGNSFSETLARSNPLEEEPTALHIPGGVRVTIKSSNAEMALQAVKNERSFQPRLYRAGDYPSQLFGKGTMQETSTRRVRTIFDAASAPYSQMVMGEVINWPGKWSSYPSHTHAQPEIYHFRFFPSQGFGYSEQGDKVYKIQEGDTALIPPQVTHPHTSAPGYALYYIWGIPHLAKDRFGPDSRIFKKEHSWLNSANASIWPDADLATVTGR